jgi:hypothetical protein
MGKVYSFSRHARKAATSNIPKALEQQLSQINAAKRKEACSLVMQAAQLLATGDANDKRTAWVLEDTLQLIIGSDPQQMEAVI